MFSIYAILEKKSFFEKLFYLKQIIDAFQVWFYHYNKYKKYFNFFVIVYLLNEQQKKNKLLYALKIDINTKK